MKVRSAVMAVALAAVLLVAGALVAGERLGTLMETGNARAGMMPEVVVKAEMPRLTMPTVEVRAVRTVAMDGQSLLVN